MPEQVDERLRRLEQRLEELERWRERLDGKPAAATPHVEVVLEQPRPDFDLALIGRTLIVLGGAYLLRALTESGIVSAGAGVAIGLLYAVFWSLLALRTRVNRSSALYHGIATAIIALPLIFEAVRKFHVLDAWAAAVALALVSAATFALVWLRQLAGVAWTFSLIALAIVPLLMLETNIVAPFALYLIALGIATLWLGYLLEWHLLRWFVAAELNVVLLTYSYLVANDRLPGASPAAAIAISCVAFGAYLTSFAVRTLVKGREVIVFEIAQTLALLMTAIGGAMWVAASRGTLELPLAALLLTLGGASYAVSFAFIPRHFATPANFVCYSSLALMLIVAGGAFITGLTNSIFWSVLAILSGYLATHYRKSSLALHAAVFIFSGFVGAGVITHGIQSLLLDVRSGWSAPAEGSILLLIACVAAAGIRPIERQGSFELWTAAKVMIFAELGWIAAAMIVSAIGFAFLGDAPPDRAVVSVLRTAVIAGLAIVAAWASRFPFLSPARLLCNAFLIALVLKLMWEDFRVGRPATLFVSLAIVGAALILTPPLRRKATLPIPAV